MKHYTQNGFTIIELIVIVLVIGILAGISTISWGNWRQGVAKKEVQSDIKLASTSMESARNFGSTGYPLTLPSTYQPSANVTVTLAASSTATAYCVQGQSTKDTTVLYYISSTQLNTVQTGSCP